jgi:osmotically-inducible protein OsmY
MNRRAEALTTSCPGVRRVRNQLEVKTPPR